MGIFDFLFGRKKAELREPTNAKHLVNSRQIKAINNRRALYVLNNRSPLSLNVIRKVYEIAQLGPSEELFSTIYKQPLTESHRQWLRDLLQNGICEIEKTLDKQLLVVRFDCRGIDSSARSISCWMHFWKAVDPNQLFGVVLYEGGLPRTSNGTEDVYCLGFETIIPSMLDTIRTVISSSQALQQVLAVPPVIDDYNAFRLVLTSVISECGMIHNGQIEGGAEADNPRAVMSAVRPGA